MVRRTLKSFYFLVFVVWFFNSFMFTTYVPFLQEKGMDKFQMGTINTFYMLAVFLLEIPTGTFADTLGRKKSFLYSLLFSSISFGVYYISNSYWFFILAEILAAFSWAFASGALEAWIVDSLKFHGFNASLNPVFAKENIVRQTSMIIGGLLGAYIGQFNLALPWLIASLGGLVSSFLANLLMKEEYFIPKKLNGLKEKTDHTLNIIKDSIIYGVKNKTVFYLISLHTSLMFGFQGFNMYWTLKFREHTSQSLIGWVWLFISLAIILGSLSNRWANSLIKKQKFSLLVYILITTCGSILCVIFYSNIFWLLLFFLLHEFGRGGFSPIKKDYINKHIPSDKRATVISFDSMIQKLGAILGLMIMGYFAKEYSIKIAWLISTIIIFLSGFICLKLDGREK